MGGDDKNAALRAVDPIGAEPLQDDNMKKTGLAARFFFFGDTLALLRKAAV